MEKDSHITGAPLESVILMLSIVKCICLLSSRLPPLLDSLQIHLDIGDDWGFVISHVDNTHIECSALYHGQEGDRQIFNIESL